MSEFLPFSIVSGHLTSRSCADVLGFENDDDVEWGGGTGFGMVLSGRPRLKSSMGEINLLPGMFFVAAGDGKISGGRGIVILQRGYFGLSMIGGPLEKTGRLKYIDGCTDTLLVCPPLKGEPSLNHLHIPKGTFQTSHFHDSDRIGVISSGHGKCKTLTGEFDLYPGMAWCIPAGVWHCFITSDESLDVVAWHPDSVFGPTDEGHPMILGTKTCSP